MPRDHSGYLRVKRLMDLVLAIGALPVVLPILALAGLAVRLDTPGPALFIQERIGLGGRHFRLYKLRTMVANAEELKASSLDSHTIHFNIDELGAHAAACAMGGASGATMLRPP